MCRYPRTLRSAALLWAAALLLPATASAAPEFEKDVLPILEAKCAGCHSGARRKAGLDVRQRRLLVRGGDSGPAIVPGRSADSPLWKLAASGEMPPGKRPDLTPEELRIIAEWIDAGAATSSPELEHVDDSAAFVRPADREHWSYRPLRRPEVPAIDGPDAGRVRNPIDAFVLRALEQAGASLAPEASERTLVRRLRLLVTGLPPSPGEVEEHLAEDDPDSYAKLVDRVLADPARGVRVGRHWLDLAGYADSEGYDDRDRERPDAWRYRDWVVGAFAEDRPLDELVLEQLAGDELAGYPQCELTPRNVELLTATGFLRMAADGTTDTGTIAARNQVIADTVKIVTSSLLGMTVACAQCHDHRYDPIAQRDYHRLRAAFEPGYDLSAWRPPAARRVSLWTAAERTRAAEVDAEVARRRAERDRVVAAHVARVIEQVIDQKVEATARDAVRAARAKPEGERSADEKALLSRYPELAVSPGTLYQYDAKAAEEVKALDDEIARIAGTKPAERWLRAFSETPGRVPPSRLLVRGDPESPAEAVAPGVPEVLVAADLSPELADDPTSSGTSGRRLRLARWLVGESNPITARVLANRIWLWHFGRGLVATPDDFGSQGEEPSHPELLDWLATELIASGWSVRHLERLIVMSSTWRQSSRWRDDAPQTDPEARLLWRRPLLRLEGEAIRDSILATSGALSTKMGGPAVPVREDAAGRNVVGVEQKAASNLPGGVVDIGEEANRRTVWIEVRRSRPLSFTKAFDVPVVETNCTRRSASIVASQALALLNGDFVRDQALRFADRLIAESADEAGRVRSAFLIAFGREPIDVELADCLDFLASQREALRERGAPTRKNESAATEPELERQALRNLCQALYNTSEFITVE